MFLTLDIALLLFQVLTCAVDENRAAQEGLKILLSHFTPSQTLRKELCAMALRALSIILAFCINCMEE